MYHGMKLLSQMEIGRSNYNFIKYEATKCKEVIQKTMRNKENFMNQQRLNQVSHFLRAS